MEAIKTEKRKSQESREKQIVDDYNEECSKPGAMKEPIKDMIAAKYGIGRITLYYMCKRVKQREEQKPK